MKRTITTIGAIGIVLTAGADTDSTQLREEFLAYKTASDARIQSLENQLTNQTNLSQAEVDSLRMLAERGTFDFEFHGYLRAGYGVGKNGSTQVPFQAPNAESKYRLGNETETYLETEFVAIAPPDMTGSKDKIFETHLRLAYAVPNANNANYESTFSVREAYGTAAGLWVDNPTATWWAGQRFYSRIQVHMTDFWYRDMSGYGGGIADVNINDKAKVGLAWIGGSIDSLSANGSVFVNPDGQMRKDNIDLSVTDIASLGGEFRVMLTYSRFNGDTVATAQGTTNKVESSHGGAINLFQINSYDNGLDNLLAVQYGVGAAFNFQARLALPQGFNSGNLVNGQNVATKDFQQFRVVEDVTYSANEKVSASATALYQYSYLGDVPMNVVQWGSLGIRPVYHFDRNYSIATEAGWDYTDQKDGDSGSLFKLTIAPQITPEMSVLSRPALRLFATYAWWSNDFEGLIGDPTYGMDTAGFSAGVQVESWW
jgi:maltoporin